jgi:hypothetical protein
MSRFYFIYDYESEHWLMGLYIGAERDPIFDRRGWKHFLTLGRDERKLVEKTHWPPLSFYSERELRVFFEKNRDSLRNSAAEAGYPNPDDPCHAE